MSVGGNDFLDTTAKAQSMREIIDKLDFIKIKKFCWLPRRGKDKLGDRD